MYRVATFHRQQVDSHIFVDAFDRRRVFMNFSQLPGGRGGRHTSPSDGREVPGAFCQSMEGK